MRLIAGLLVVLLGSGCRNGADRAQKTAGTDSTVVDTTNRDPLDGMSRGQIERTARPMTPEQARQMGLIDTTITIEDQSSGAARLDSAP